MSCNAAGILLTNVLWSAPTHKHLKTWPVDFQKVRDACQKGNSSSLHLAMISTALRNFNLKDEHTQLLLYPSTITNSASNGIDKMYINVVDPEEES